MFSISLIYVKRSCETTLSLLQNGKHGYVFACLSLALDISG